jgi:hypothetical protein
MFSFHKNRVHDNIKNKPETLKAIEHYISTATAHTRCQHTPT